MENRQNNQGRLKEVYWCPTFSGEDTRWNFKAARNVVRCFRTFAAVIWVNAQHFSSLRSVEYVNFLLGNCWGPHRELWERLGSFRSFGKYSGSKILWSENSCRKFMSPRALFQYYIVPCLYYWHDFLSVSPPALFQYNFVPCLYCRDNFLPVFQWKILFNQRVQRLIVSNETLSNTERKTNGIE